MMQRIASVLSQAKHTVYSKIFNDEPIRLTMKDALLIRCESPKDLQKVDPNLLPYVTLNKIMTCEYENGLCCCDTQSFINWDGDSDDDDDDEKDDNTIHPVDNLLSLIHFSDNFLRQAIMLKLSLCKVAVPLLLPNHFKDTLTLLLWAIRSITIKWEVGLSKNTNKYFEYPIVDYAFPIISFVRIGSLHVSKSDILNQVIGEHKFFFFKGCKRVQCKKKLTEGLIDFCYYLPNSKADQNALSCNPVLFLNLHGDARKCKKQIDFIQKLSVLSFIFVHNNELDGSAKQIITKLSQNDKTILFVERNSQNKSASRGGEQVSLPGGSNIQICYFKPGRAIQDFQQSIQIMITETIKNNKKTVKLSECSTIASHCGIDVDENDKYCKEGHKKAKKIIDEIKLSPPIEAKLKYFPLQGPEGWQKWAEIDRTQHKEFGKQISDLEKYQADKNGMKLEVRKKMEYHCNNLNKPIDKFIKILSNTSDHTIKHYFITWLKLLLDNYNREVFATFNNKKLVAKERHKAMIGLEHFFREMGQMYETVKCLKRGLKISSSVVKFPCVMAELISQGYYMEIMDGDSTHVPVHWVSAVFKELHRQYNNDTIYSVSIVGVQSTGKSTLLNTMFGLNFNVSAGRCTRGAFMQLLSFHKDAKLISRCDHLLLVDTEGLRAPELQFISKQHDNELATFVVGLADVAIINMGGESPGDLSDILQTVSHGLIRIKNIEISPSCKFVHHHVTEPGAKAKTASGKQKFLEVLDENVQKACELELCKGNYNSFSELMKFDESQDILYFKPLWHGNPPMAKVNIQYTEDAQALKMSLINHAGKYKSFCSFNTFYTKIESLWDAVLDEQFLFSFRSTLELIVRKEYDQLHGEWNAELRIVFLEWECKARNSLIKDKGKNTKEWKKMLLKTIVSLLQQKKDEIIQKRDIYFVENEHNTILAEWKAKSNENIDSYYKEFIEKAEFSIAQMVIEHASLIEVEEMTKTIHTQLETLADKLFASSPDVPDKVLQDKFQKKWSEWLDYIPSAQYKSSKDIEHDICTVLQKFFEMDSALLNQKLLLTPLKERKPELKLNAERHFEVKKLHMHGVTKSEIFVHAEFLTLGWLKHFREHMESLQTKEVYSFLGMLHQFEQQLNELIKKVKNTNSVQAFQFTKEFVIDIALAASKQTKDLLINCEDRARKNDPKHELEKKKLSSLELLHVLYDDRKKTRQEVTDIKNQCEQEKKNYDALLIDQREKHIAKKKKLQNEFETDLQQMKQNCVNEKDLLIKTHSDEKQELEEQMNDIRKKHEEAIKEIEESIRNKHEELQEHANEAEERKAVLNEKYKQDEQFIEEKLKMSRENNEKEIAKLDSKVKRAEREYDTKIKELDEKCTKTKELKEQEYEQSKAENKRYQKLLKLNQHVVAYLVQIIKGAITKVLQNSLIPKICIDLTKFNPNFKSKEIFKSAVLKELLEQADFDEYKLYFTDPEKSLKNWMCHFVNQHCIKVDHSTNLTKFQKLRDCEVKDLVESVKTAIKEACINDKPLTFFCWINEVFANIQKTSKKEESKSISLSECDIMSISKINLPWKSLEDVEELKELLLLKLDLEIITKDSKDLYNAMEHDLMEYTWKVIKETLLGCTACCPFCKEMCDNTTVCKEGQKHAIELHRPQCFAKYTWIPSRKIVVEVCSTLVGSNRNCRFRNEDTQWEWLAYNQYHTLYTNWIISNKSTSLKPYWMYVTCYFDKKIAEWCNDGKTESIPKEWYDITKREARDCLHSPEN